MISPTWSVLCLPLKVNLMVNLDVGNVYRWASFYLPMPVAHIPVEPELGSEPVLWGGCMGRKGGNGAPTQERWPFVSPVRPSCGAGKLALLSSLALLYLSPQKLLQTIHAQVPSALPSFLGKKTHFWLHWDAKGRKLWSYYSCTMVIIFMSCNFNVSEIKIIILICSSQE